MIHTGNVNTCARNHSATGMLTGRVPVAPLFMMGYETRKSATSSTIQSFERRQKRMSASTVETSAMKVLNDREIQAKAVVVIPTPSSAAACFAVRPHPSAQA